ncbi:RING-H2 finger protein ATL78-like [Silene latifolia]|uniref:RING-H2 finger protein ATL78-like n=1 Tax=Silene latifolia TaxID=37657 RepID=UPI003D78787C
MLPSTSLSSLPQEIIKNPHYSRRLLFQPYTNQAPSPNNQQMINPSLDNGNHTTFAANVVLILSILICSAVITLVVNSLIKCVVKCLSLHTREHNYYLDMINHQKPSTGVDNKAMKTLPVIKYSSEINIQGLGTECVICLSEFKVAETIRILPKCNHGFHVKCIDKWLSSHSSCPTCRQSLVDSCDTVIGCHHHQPTTLSSAQAITGETTVTSIMPLEQQ